MNVVTYDGSNGVQTTLVDGVGVGVGVTDGINDELGVGVIEEVTLGVTDCVGVTDGGTGLGLGLGDGPTSFSTFIII
jgi:hypothetical protein